MSSKILSPSKIDLIVYNSNNLFTYFCAYLVYNRMKQNWQVICDVIDNKKESISYRNRNVLFIGAEISIAAHKIIYNDVESMYILTKEPIRSPRAEIGELAGCMYVSAYNSLITATNGFLYGSAPLTPLMNLFREGEDSTNDKSIYCKFFLKIYLFNMKKMNAVIQRINTERFWEEMNMMMFHHDFVVREIAEKETQFLTQYIEGKRVIVAYITSSHFEKEIVDLLLKTFPKIDVVVKTTFRKDKTKFELFRQSNTRVLLDANHVTYNEWSPYLPYYIFGTTNPEHPHCFTVTWFVRIIAFFMVLRNWFLLQFMI
jgi:hypothetical protein